MIWHFLSYQTQGRSHLKTNTPCQDKTFSLQKHNVSVIALSDGAGSARLSHFGADESVKFIAKDMAQNFDMYFKQDKVKSEIIRKLQRNIELLAKKYNCSAKDLACTLACVAVKRNHFIVLHVGDGVVGCLRNNRLEVLSVPDNGEFVNTTSFITAHNVLDSMRFLCGNADRINGFVLMSDGSEASLYNKREKSLAPVLKAIMQSSIPLVKLQIGLQNSFENVIKKTTSDDCSIAIMFKKSHCAYTINLIKKAFPNHTLYNNRLKGT